jgi:hypothetical protein
MVSSEKTYGAPPMPGQKGNEIASILEELPPTGGRWPEPEKKLDFQAPSLAVPMARLKSWIHSLTLGQASHRQFARSLT